VKRLTYHHLRLPDPHHRMRHTVPWRPDAFFLAALLFPSECISCRRTGLQSRAQRQRKQKQLTVFCGELEEEKSCFHFR